MAQLGIVLAKEVRFNWIYSEPFSFIMAYSNAFMPAVIML